MTAGEGQWIGEPAGTHRFAGVLDEPCVICGLMFDERPPEGEEPLAVPPPRLRALGVALFWAWCIVVGISLGVLAAHLA